jgi:hypothetical protein
MHAMVKRPRKLRARVLYENQLAWLTEGCGLAGGTSANRTGSSYGEPVATAEMSLCFMQAARLPLQAEM